MLVKQAHPTPRYVPAHMPSISHGGTLARELAADAVAARVTGRSGQGGNTASPERHSRREPLAGNALAAMALGARRSVDSVGQPLPAATRMLLENTMGTDLSAVRVHASDAAGGFVASLGANAATVGHDILGSAASLDPASAAGLRVLAHECAHTVQGRAGSAAPISLDAIDDVQDKLSYGLRDWAVTDADATSALAILQALPAPALAAGLSRLDQKYIDRLIDNLPDAAKSGPGYQKVITAIGAARALPEATDKLSYGLFDWAVTDADVTSVFTTMINLPAPEQERFLSGLQADGKLTRLISNSTPGHHTRFIQPWIQTLVPGRLTAAQQGILRDIVRESAGGPLATLAAAASVRFNVPVGRGAIGGMNPANWTPEALSIAYLALDTLPDSHVARNATLRTLGAVAEVPDARGETTLGIYSGSSRELDLNVLRTDKIAETALHETGHSVDKALGWTASITLPADPKRGGWTQYGGSFGICARDMINDSNAGIGALPSAQRDDVQTEMETSMTNRSAAGMTARIRALPWFAGLPLPARTGVTTDPALGAVREGLDHPWFNNDGGVHLGTATPRVYEESYGSKWNSYQYQARTRLLTDYQFRDPGEWFAEIYAFYFGGAEKRRQLTAKDPDTAAYFAASVTSLAPGR
ncbi:DUF4157 domain-containing protein [Arthrobacter sp. LAPM80]|uniref:eCIS core domain-containing protein n=1 Tax=Arthrobacter sp. LAPM80 TaxID=3141788 RepID=UPI00398B4F16